MAAPAEEPKVVADETTPEEKTNPGGLAGAFASLKMKAKAYGDLAKQEALNYKEKIEARITMEGCLDEANKSLAKFLNPKLDMEKQIPVELMKNAEGVVLLSVVKASIGIGASIGAGVIVSKLENGAGWSGPCSIGIVGGQWGFNIGAQKTDFVIILRDEKAKKLFTSKGQLKFGADASIAAGSLGRNAAMAVGANEETYAATVSYGETKGLYIGVALEGQGISVRDDCNEKFYGKKVTVQEILSAPYETGKNENYDSIVKLLDDYCAQQAMAEEGAKVAEQASEQPL